MVAILNGITMGGGTGISVPSLFRVATDKTVFATPETLIGFHPDAGASFRLSHLPGYLGEYLGLTGDRISGVDMMACGLATHYSPIANLSSIEEHLRNLVTNDPSVLETSLQKYGNLAYPDNSSVLGRMEIIDKCFRHETVEEIIDTLESEAAKTQDEWCFSTLKKRKEASPLSLKVSLKSDRRSQDSVTIVIADLGRTDWQNLPLQQQNFVFELGQAFVTIGLVSAGIWMTPSYFTWNHFIASSFVTLCWIPTRALHLRRLPTRYPGLSSTT